MSRWLFCGVRAGTYVALPDVDALQEFKVQTNDSWLNGDFSGFSRQIYDPCSTRIGVLVRDPFPGNVIPASRITGMSGRPRQLQVGFRFVY